MEDKLIRLVGLIEQAYRDGNKREVKKYLELLMYFLLGWKKLFQQHCGTIGDVFLGSYSQSMTFTAQAVTEQLRKTHAQLFALAQETGRALATMAEYREQLLAGIP